MTGRVWVAMAAVACCMTGAAQVPVNAGLQRTLEAMAGEPAVARAHWGVSVVRMDGAVAAGVNAGQFFQPASNAKLFTTAAAMALLPMEERLRTQVLASGTAAVGGVLQGDLVLVGAGDSNLSGRPVPYVAVPAGQSAPPRDELRYVTELARAVKAAGIREVTSDVVGEDTAFPWDPYPEDWAIDDRPWYYGAPVSGLSVGDSAVTLRVRPGAVGEPATVEMGPALPYYTVRAEVTTGAAGTATEVEVTRPIAPKTVLVRGTLPADATPYVQALSVDDPAEYAAMALKAALEAEGVTVGGKAVARHGTLFEPDFRKAAGVPLERFARRAAMPEPLAQCPALAGAAGPLPLCALAEHAGPPLYQDVVVTNKVSQNQHAEMFLRLLGMAETGTGTTAQGARVVRAFLTQKAGVEGGDFVLVDGSGLSGHDLVTPRAVTTLLRYAAGQPWGSQWKDSLPVGGVDGSLRRRFSGPLAGKVFAKTGTLGEARALSGYLVCASGKTVVFSVMVTGHTPLDATDEAVMDRMVGAIAAAE